MNSKSLPLYYWIVIVFLVGFCLIAPYQRALFNGRADTFDGPIYWSILFAALTFLIFTLSTWSKGELHKKKDWLTLSVWLIPLSFTLSSFVAVSPYSSTNTILIQCFYAILFTSVSLIRHVHQAVGKLAGVIIGSGVLIVLFGFMNWFGDASLFGLFNWNGSHGNLSGVNTTYKDAVYNNGVDIRLASVFQYPNTYAAYLLALLFTVISMISANNNRWVSLVCAASAAPIILSFLLTGSRGALVIVPIYFLIALLLLSLSRQIMFTLHLSTATLAAVLVLHPITKTGLELQIQFNHLDNIKSWGLLLGASFLSAFLSFALERFIHPQFKKFLGRFESNKLTFLLLPIAGLVAGLGGGIFLFASGATRWLPETIRVRLEAIDFGQHSVLERGTFYSDAMKVIRDFPILGTGGGGWSSLYVQYQNNPYISREAHNFVLQYWVETGTIGLLIFILFSFFVLYRYIQSHRNSGQEQRDRRLPFIFMFSGIFLHSLIDFDMSYVYIGAIMFVCLGALRPESVDQTHQSIAKLKFQRKNTLAPAFFIIISILLLISSSKLIAASESHKQAIQALKRQPINFYEVSSYLDKAIANSRNPEFVLLKANLLINVYSQSKNEQFLQEATQILNKTALKEPYHPIIFEYQLNTMALRNDRTAMLEHLKRGIHLFTWNQSIYERFITLSFEQGSTNPSRAEWKDALETYQSMTDKIKHLQTLPKGQNQGNDFSITPAISLSIGQIYYTQRQYQEAATALKYSLTEPLPKDLAIARYYLASILRMGQKDDALYKKVIELDPQEQMRIEELIKIK